MRNAVHVLLTESPYSSWTNSTTSRFSAGFRAFFRSHPSRPDFPGLSPHTFFEKGVFMLKVAHTLDVRSFHAAELALPSVERGTADRAHDIRPWQSCPLRQTSGLWWFGVQKTVTSSWLPPGDGLPEVSSFGLYYFKGGLHIHTNVSYRGIEARF